MLCKSPPTESGGSLDIIDLFARSNKLFFIFAGNNFGVRILDKLFGDGLMGGGGGGRGVKERREGKGGKERAGERRNGSDKKGREWFEGKD